MTYSSVWYRVWMIIYMCIFTTFEGIRVAGSNPLVFSLLVLLHD